MTLVSLERTLAITAFERLAFSMSGTWMGKVGLVALKNKRKLSFFSLGRFRLFRI